MSGSTHRDQDYGNNKKSGSEERCPWTVYIQCCFVSVATVLGTGILGLPDKLSASGFTPFVLTFTICFIIQLLLVIYFTDIIQRCQARLDEEQNVKLIEAIPLVEATNEFFDDFDDEAEFSLDPPLTPQSQVQINETRQSPSLTLLAQFFLPKYLAGFFNANILVGFVAIMISYCLAAGKEYSALLHIDQTIVTAVFGMGFGLFVVFGYRVVKPVISTLTFLKGSVLVAVVSVTIMVSSNSDIEIHNDFSKVMEPLLMSTIALGGAVNVMPMLFCLLPSPNSFKQVRGFRRAICCGVLICYVLNLTWCWAVLNIVPQQCEALRRNNVSCHVSLENAELKGEPSTIPLKQMILMADPSYRWITVFIQIFIIVSISVSFLTHVAAFSHTIDGLIIYWLRKKRRGSNFIERLEGYRVFRYCSSETAFSHMITITALLCIVGFAMLRPNSFVIVLERLGSLTLNMECGPLMFLMIVISNAGVNKRLSIPIPMPKWFHVSAVVILLFGLFSLAFDIYGFVNSFLMTKVGNATVPSSFE